MKKAIVAYIPVLHQGYLEFLQQAEAQQLFILGSEIIQEFSHLYKDIHALDPLMMKQIIQGLNLFDQVNLLSPNNVANLNKSDCQIEMPNEDIMQELANKYLDQAQVEFMPIFLRWDKHQATQPQPVSPDVEISQQEFDQQVMKQAFKQADHSSDFWRHVGAVIVRDGQIILAGYNRHLPSPHQPYTLGDPRNNFHKGEGIKLSTAIHAEANLIATAARQGISLENAQMYVTNFPCPVCAKLVAESGISKLYFSRGYGVLDGEQVLRDQGIEIIQVKGEFSQDEDKSKRSRIKPYQKS